MATGVHRMKRNASPNAGPSVQDDDVNGQDPHPSLFFPNMFEDAQDEAYEELIDDTPLSPEEAERQAELLAAEALQQEQNTQAEIHAPDGVVEDDEGFAKESLALAPYVPIDPQLYDPTAMAVAAGPSRTVPEPMEQERVVVTDPRPLQEIRATITPTQRAAAASGLGKDRAMSGLQREQNVNAIIAERKEEKRREEAARVAEAEAAARAQAEAAAQAAAAEAARIAAEEERAAAAERATNVDIDLDVALNEVPGYELRDLITGTNAEGPNNSFQNLFARHDLSMAGASAAAQQVWTRWIREVVDRERQQRPEQFCKQFWYMEDLLLGPVDRPRRLHNGFERQIAPSAAVDVSQPTTIAEGDVETVTTAKGPVQVRFASEIVWQAMVPRADNPTRLRPVRMASAAHLLAFMDEEMSKHERRIRFQPRRILKISNRLTRVLTEYEAPTRIGPTGATYRGGGQRKQRDELGLTVYDAVSGKAVLEPTLNAGKKWARKTDGSRIFVDGKPLAVSKGKPVPRVTTTLRLLIREIPLTEDHWEWIFSRYLKNDDVAEVARKVPHMNTNKTFQPHLAGVAIPLLTPGTMNFYSLRMNPRVNTAFTPRLAIENESEINVLNVRALERVYIEPSDRTGQTTMQSFVNAFWHSGRSVVKTQDRIRIALDADCLDIATIFCVIPAGSEPATADLKKKSTEYEYYRNVYVLPKAASDEIKTLTGIAPVDDYKHQPTPASALAATFLGLPLYFMPSSEQRPGVSQMIDIRVAHAADESADQQYYSTVYREVMFKPSPMLGVRTFPPMKSGVQASKFDGQFLNFSFNRRQARNATAAQTAQPARSANTTEDDNEDVVSIQDEDDTEEDRRLEERQRLFQNRVDICAKSVAPRIHSNARAPLLQRYPEVVMAFAVDARTRAREASKFLRSAAAENMEHEFRGFYSANKLKPVPDDNNAAGVREWRTLLNYDADASSSKRLLGPTRLKEAIERYMHLNAKFMENQYKSSTPESAFLDPLKVQQSGGFYVSARIDTGPQSGSGGVDTFFPIPLDSGVYEIADVNLARGVHEHFVTSDKPAFRNRLGPPVWYQRQKELMRQEAERVAETTKRNGTKFEILKNAPKGPTGSTLNARINHTQYTNRIKDTRGSFDAPAGARGLFFDPIATRRLDYTDMYGFHPQLLKTHLNQFESTQSMLPSKLRMPKLKRDPTAPNACGRVVDTVEKQSRQATVLFKPYVTSRAKFREEDSLLPHRSDFEVETMLTYPQRMSLAARNAVWYRLSALKDIEEQDGTPEIVDDAQGRGRMPASMLPTLQQQQQTDVPEFNKEARSDLDLQRKQTMHSLTTNLYLLKLDFDDFFRAVEECDTEWATFMRAHPNYYYYADMFLVTETTPDDASTAYLMENPDYQYAESTVPPRTCGDWSTHDGPYDALYESNPELYKFARRPHEATRDRWFRDRRRFGGWIRDEDRGIIGRDPQLQFKADVERWSGLYTDYLATVDKYRDINATNTKLLRIEGTLREASLRVCWALARLRGAASDPSTLYQATPADTEMCTRISVPIFIVDLLDNAATVRATIADCTFISDTLRASEDLQQLIRDHEDPASIAYVREFADKAFQWPTPSEIGGLMRRAGHEALAKIVRICETTAVADWQSAWKTIKRRANALLNETLASDADAQAYADGIRQRAPLLCRKRYAVAAQQLEATLQEMITNGPDGGPDRPAARWLALTGVIDAAPDAVPPPASTDYVAFLMLTIAFATPSASHVPHVLTPLLLPIMYALMDSWRDWLVESQIRAVKDAGNSMLAAYARTQLAQVSIRIPRSKATEPRRDLDGIEALFGLEPSSLLYRKEQDAIEDVESASYEAARTDPRAFFRQVPNTEILQDFPRMTWDVSVDAFGLVFKYLKNRDTDTSLLFKIVFQTLRFDDDKADELNAKIHDVTNRLSGILNMRGQEPSKTTKEIVPYRIRIMYNAINTTFNKMVTTYANNKRDAKKTAKEARLAKEAEKRLNKIYHMIVRAQRMHLQVLRVIDAIEAASTDPTPEMQAQLTKAKAARTKFLDQMIRMKAIAQWLQDNKNEGPRLQGFLVRMRNNYKELQVSILNKQQRAPKQRRIGTDSEPGPSTGPMAVEPAPLTESPQPSVEDAFAALRADLDAGLSEPVELDLALASQLNPDLAAASDAAVLDVDGLAKQIESLQPNKRLIVCDRGMRIIETELASMEAITKEVDDGKELDALGAEAFDDFFGDDEATKASTLALVVEGNEVATELNPPALTDSLDSLLKKELQPKVDRLLATIGYRGWTDSLNKLRSVARQQRTIYEMRKGRMYETVQLQEFFTTLYSALLDNPTMLRDASDDLDKINAALRAMDESSSASSASTPEVGSGSEGAYRRYVTDLLDLYVDERGVRHWSLNTMPLTPGQFFMSDEHKGRYPALLPADDDHHTYQPLPSEQTAFVKTPAEIAAPLADLPYERSNVGSSIVQVVAALVDADLETQRIQSRLLPYAFDFDGRNPSYVLSN